jgi:hypothetical protein
MEPQPGNHQSLHSVLEYINKAKLTDNKPLCPPQAILIENRTLVGQLANAGLGWVQPSGAPQPVSFLHLNSGNNELPTQRRLCYAL